MSVDRSLLALAPGRLGERRHSLLLHVETPINLQNRWEKNTFKENSGIGVLHHGQKMTFHMSSSLILWLALYLICVDGFLPCHRATDQKFLTKTFKFFASSANEPTESLASVLQELNRRGIRYLPDASRQELMRLLQNNQDVKQVESEAPKSKSKAKAVVSSNLPPKRPIQELLKELDDRGIRYPSRGSRAELEQLLQEAKNEPDTTTMSADFTAPTPTGSTVRRPLREILQLLDGLDISFSPSASRQELEFLLENGMIELENNNGKDNELPSATEMIESDDTPNTSDDESFQDEDDGRLKAQSVQPRLSIRELLQALDDRGVEYPSRGSRAELEHLFKYSEKVGFKSSRRNESNPTDKLLDKRVEEEMDPSAKSPMSPMTDDRRNLTSTRSERLDSSARVRERPARRNDDEVPQSKRGESEDSASPHSEDSAFPTSAREEWAPSKPSEEPDDRMSRRQQRLQRQESTATPLQSIFTKIPKSAAKAVTGTIPPRVVQIGQRAANAAVRKVKKVSRNAVQFIIEEEEDDDEEDETPVQPERVVEVEPLPMDQVRTTNNGFSPPTEQNSKDVNPRPRSSRRNTTVDKSDVLEPNSSRSSSPPFIKRPISDIINDLNHAGIPYAASASRNELQELLASISEKKEPTEKEKTAEFVPPTRSSPNASQDQKGTTWGDLLFTSKRRVDNGRRKVARRVSSFRSKNSEGDILDAIIEDYSRNDILIDVKAEAMHVDDTVKKARRVPYRNPSSAGNRSSNVNSSRSDRVASRRATSSYRPSPNPGNRDPSASRTRRPSSGASRSPLSDHQPLPPQLPPQFDREDIISDRDQPKEKQRGYRRPSGGKRRIYSPFVSENPEHDEYDKDTIDQFGEFGDFVANAADSFIWGPEEGATKKASKQRRRERPDQGNGPPGRDRRRPHWKDRMEMNFDYFLGIHEDGKVYNRWLEEDLEAERTKGKRRKGVYERPLWEEEGSVLSMLFGNKSSGFLDGRSPSFNGPGSMVKLFRSLSRSLLILASGVARWASVRGSLPQYVVVLSVAAAGLSARPGNRLWVLGLTLIAMRTMGELLHGYTYDDFEFDSEDDMDEDDEGSVEDSQ
jgi:hypothetical protein